MSSEREKTGKFSDNHIASIHSSNLWENNFAHLHHTYMKSYNKFNFNLIFNKREWAIEIGGGSEDTFLLVINTLPFKIAEAIICQSHKRKGVCYELTMCRFFFI